MKRIVDGLLRYALAAVFLLYGFAKVVGMQFMHFELDDRVCDIHPVTLVWYFFGYSRPYALFIAFGELTAAMLLLFGKTFRFGLLVYASIAVNVAVLDWSFGLPLPATLLATSLAAAALYLIAVERRVYARLFTA